MAPPGYERRHGQTERNGTWEALANLTFVSEAPSYKATKWKVVGRVADETVVLMMFCENRTEGRVSAELRHPKNGRSVHYPVRDYQAQTASGCLEDVVPPSGIKVQESRMKENFTYGLTRGKGATGMTALLSLLYKFYRLLLLHELTRFFLLKIEHQQRVG